MPFYRHLQDPSFHWMYWYPPVLTGTRSDCNSRWRWDPWTHRQQLSLQCDMIHHISSFVLGYVTCILLMYVCLYILIRLLPSQYVVYVLTLKVNFQFGCWIVKVYGVCERWHVLPWGEKKLCYRINIKCGFGCCWYVHRLTVSCFSYCPPEHVSNPKSDVPAYIHLIIEQHNNWLPGRLANSAVKNRSYEPAFNSYT